LNSTRSKEKRHVRRLRTPDSTRIRTFFYPPPGYPARIHRIVTDRTVDSHVKHIRKKLAAVLPEREVLVSAYGAGYKFEW
jgi:hypothetical protein